MNPTQARRQRLVTLLVALALIALGAWVWYRSLDRSRPPESTGPQQPAVSVDADSLGEVQAKQLPEYAELKAFFPLKGKALSREQTARALELASHSNTWIRLRSLHALGHADDAMRGEATAAVVARLRDPSIHVRLAAMDALASLDAKDHIADLLPFLKSADRDEQNGAKDALKWLGHPVE